MLSVYTRHYPPCPHHDLHYRRCHCPKWVKARQRQLTASVRRAWFPEVTMASSSQGRGAAIRPVCPRPTRSHWLQFHVDRNVPTVHAFFLYV
jgi:hypothetical protein